MARKKIDFTYEELVEEIEFFANMLTNDIRDQFGWDFCLAVKDNYIDGKPTIYREFTSEDIKNSMPATDAYYGYHYALGDIFLGHGRDDTDQFLGDGMEQFYDLFKQSMKPDSKYAFVYNLAVARDRLDQGKDLTIKEIALLTSVDERTIRNSASSKDENSLSIEKFGGSTIIKNSEAVRWLSRRPDFKQTQYVENEIINSPRYFKDEVGFGNFITFKRNELELTHESISEAANVDLGIIVDLEKGIDRININQVKKLAEILEEDTTVFFKDYMRIFHLEELANLLGASTNKFQLVFFKSQLNIESELEVFNWQKKRQEFQETEK
jgi:transcriptional regulator with XRE-family HTH domain